MPTPERFSGLRARLRAVLHRVIDDPEIERKELAAFDIVMSRRDVLKHMGVVGALVATGTPPTMWGRREPDLAVAPSAVGLTPAEQASVQVASQLSVGTELFQDTVYAQQVVAPDAVASHAVVEGARGRLRAQSDFASDDPLESQFLDTGYHFGPPELVQLEPVGSSDWRLSHYFHPWGARSDGARTDGLERANVIEEGNLVDPTKVVAITGTATNGYVAGEGSQDARMAYAAFVQDEGAGVGGGWLAIGTGKVGVEPPYNTADAYPVEWQWWPLSEFQEFLPVDQLGVLADCDRYVAGAYGSPSDYDARQATEHIVLHFEVDGDNAETLRSTWIFTLVDDGPAGTLSLQLAALQPPLVDTTPWRVVDIDFDPTQPGADGAYEFTSATLATTTSDSNDGQLTHQTHTFVPADATVKPRQQLPFSDSYLWVVDYDGGSPAGEAVTLPSETPDGLSEFDFSTATGVHTLFTISGPDYFGDASDPYPYRVAVATFGTAGLAAFVLGPASNNGDLGVDAFAVDALYPVTLPDDAGVGVINNLSGGTSKFGGFRLVASDDDGNVFLLRQRRDSASGSTYDPAIYCQFDDTGSPRTDWSSTSYDPLPSGTASASPLHDLQTWCETLATEVSSRQLAYNLLLSMLVGLSTTSSNVTQGTWLGNGFQAAYALSRFGSDSTHVVVKAAQGGAANTYAAYTMFSNPVTHAWHERLIAMQVEPQAPGENEPGDHYQATVTPVNAYGQPVPLGQGANADLVVEVRADVPTLVTDDTHNYYYDVDQYSSFMAAADPSSGNLVLLVKADSFAQLLYLRLVDTTGLQPSGSDSSMLATVSEAVFPWVAVNMAAQAQQRMGNTSDGAADGPLPDTTVYVSGSSLQASDATTPWDFKQGYGNDPKYGDVGSYLNTSGQNMLQVSATTSGDAVDPLTSTTPVSGATMTPGTTAFAYAAGTVTHTTSTTDPGGELGSVWSGIDHALHDALHWLQHVAGEVYDDLAGDGVQLAIDVQSITVTVSADIMKQMTGVAEDLVQAVDTVEEYASVVVNVLVTIVEDSFVYQFIELLIALISLFAHLQDIIDLSHSLRDRFDDIVGGTYTGSVPTLPSGYTFASTADDYLGPGNQTAQAMQDLDVSDVANDVVQGLGQDVLANPLTSKILTKVVAEISRFVSGESSTSPIEFSMDVAAVETLVGDVAALADDVVSSVVDLTTDVVEAFVDEVSSDLDEPRSTFSNLADTLGPFSEAIVVDVLDDVFDLFDTIADDAAATAVDAFGQDPYVTLKIPVLADLCKLFQLGTASGTELKMNAKESVFFPLALVIWVAVYMETGKSISSVDQLGDPSSADLPGASSTSMQRIDQVVFLVTGFLGGALWSATRGPSASSGATGPAAAAGAWINTVHRANDMVSAGETWDSMTAVDKFSVLFRLATALMDDVITANPSQWNTGTGWPTDPTATQIDEYFNALATIAKIVGDTVAEAESGQGDDAITIDVGVALAETQVIVAAAFDVAYPDDAELYPVAAVAVTILPVLGMGLALIVEDPSDPEDVWTPPGRPDQPGRSDPPGLSGDTGRPDQPGRSDPPGLSGDTGRPDQPGRPDPRGRGRR